MLALVGLPGAGKTLFCEKISSKADNFGTKIVHICFDDLFPWSNDEDTYKENRKKMLDLVELSVLKSKDKTVIVIDDNNYYQSMRYKQIQLCRKLGVAFGILYIPLTLEECLSRNEKRQLNRLPEDVIKKMASSLETPLKCFHYDQGTKIQTVFEYLEEKFRNPLKQAIQRTPMTQSQIHVYDLYLRKLVSAKIKEIAGNKKMAANQLNEKRKVILKDIRNSELTVENLEHLDLIFES